MAVLSINEYNQSPSNPDQWDRYYNTELDKVYLQVLPKPSDSAVKITVPIGGAVRSGKIVTIDFSADHHFVVGDKIIVSSMDDSSFDGEFFILDVPDSEKIEYAQDAANATSENGDVEPAYPEWEEVTTGRELREDVRVIDPVIKTKYSGKDYQTFLDEGLSWLRERYGDKFNTFIESDPAIMHAMYTAGAQDALAWYQDLEATEFFWKHMKIRRRAEEKARRIGYAPRPAVACSVDVDIELSDGPYSYDITLSKSTHKFLGPSNLVFELQQNQLTFFAGELKKEKVALVQSVIKQLNFVSSGEANQQFVLSVDDGEFITKDSVRVWVGGDEWTVNDNFDFDASNQLEIWYGAYKVVVGNGVIGNIPDSNLDVVIEYGVTRGLDGRLAISGTIDSLSDSLIVNFNEIPLVINNSSGAIGGDNAEQLEEIIVNAPKYFDTAARGTTVSDLTTLTNIYSDASAGSVAKGKASIIRGIAEDLSLLSKLQDVQDAVDQILLKLNSIDNSVDLITASREEIAEKVLSILSNKNSIDSNKDLADQYLDSANGVINQAKVAIERIYFREVLVEGDGSTSEWTGGDALQASRIPIAPNTVFLWVDDYDTESSGSDGDCDTSPGSMISASADFTDREGRIIKIGNQLRRIVRVISATVIEYSGDFISGTGLEWVLYENAITGIDDGDGSIIGNGINFGSIDYDTGAIGLDLNYAPAGTSGYGTNILISYGYYDNSLDNYLDNIFGYIGDAETSLNDLITNADNIESDTGVVSSELDDIESLEGNINTSVIDAQGVPIECANKMSILSDYLDANLSGECKANIVRVQVLVKDIDGFYTAPSQALLTSLQDSLQEKAVAPTTVVAVSGYYFIVAVDMEIEIKISKPYKYSTILPEVEDVIDSLFKNRDYGESLYRSQYYNAVVPITGSEGGVAGISYANINITGTSFPDVANDGVAPTVDDDGNLIIGNKYILTKGSIVYSEID